MARKRGYKKKSGSSRKQPKRQGDSVPDVPPTDSAEQEQPLLQARSREEHMATVHWTSPDTVPVENAHVVQTKGSSSNNKGKNKSSSKGKNKSSSKGNNDNRRKTPTTSTFFSPPAPDFASMKSPERQPINTPYSSRRQPLSGPYSDSDYYDSSSASEASPDRQNENNGSGSTNRSARRRQSRSGLKDQVRDLDNLLTSPLTFHLGNLADETPKRALGPMRDGGEDDDMSEEWDQLAQSEHLLRAELESFDMGPLTSNQKQSGGNSSESRSVPPGIARQRLDPIASPLHPFNLFPRKNDDDSPETKNPPSARKNSPEEKKEETPGKKNSASNRNANAYESPPRPQRNRSLHHFKSSADRSNSSLHLNGGALPPQNNTTSSTIKSSQNNEFDSDPNTTSQNKAVTLFESPQFSQAVSDKTTTITAATPQENNATVYKSPRTRSSKSSTVNNTRNESKYYSAINASSISHDSSTEHLGHELDQLVNSMPLFDSTDDAFVFNNLSGASNQSKDARQTSTGPDYVGEELSHLVHSVQEQLEASTVPQTPPTKKKKPKKRRTMVNITQSKSPDMSFGAIQVIEPDEPTVVEDSHGQHPYDEAADDDYDENEDDDMSAELDQLEESQHLMQKALAMSYDEYALPSKPTPQSPPQLTGDLIQNGSRPDGSLFQPVPVMPSPLSHNEEKEKHMPNLRSATTATTAATVTTMGGTSVTQEGFGPASPQSRMSSAYNRRLSGTSNLDTVTSTQAGVAARQSSSSDTPLSSASNDTSGAVAFGVSNSSPSSTQTGPRQETHHPTTPENKKPVTPPPILTPEQMEQLQEMNVVGSFPTPPSAASSARRSRSHIVCGTYSTPTRSQKQTEHADTPGGKSTPGSRSSRGSAVKTLLVAPCGALQHLVRTPSPDGAEQEGVASTRPFQFVDGVDDSSDSSQSLVPFSPDELNYRQNQYAQLYPDGRTIAKGTVSWEKEFEIETPQQREGDIEMSEMLKTEGQRSQPGYWMAYRYNQQLGIAEVIETPEDVSDLLSNSQSRMKELQQQQRGIEMQKLKRTYDDVEMQKMNEHQQGQGQRYPHPGGGGTLEYQSDSEVMSDSNTSPAARRRQLRQIKYPIPASVRDIGALPVSPISKRRSQSFSHRSPTKMVEPSPPTSTRSADTWRIKSRADGGKSLSTLDAVLADLSAYRPKKTTPVRKTSSKSMSTTSHIETPPRVYMNVLSNSHSSDEADQQLLVDVENPNSDKGSDESPRKPCSIRKRGLICATICLVWLIVMGIVITLSLLIIRGRDDAPSSTSLIGGAQPATSNTTVVPSVSPTDDFGFTANPTYFPVVSPPMTPPTTPVSTPDSTTKPTTRPPSLRPDQDTLPATPRPTGTLRPVSDSTLSLIRLLNSRSVDVREALSDRSSPEYAALQWLSGNALLDSYSDQQKVQRFVLGTLYYSLNGDEWTLNSRWLSDWDECRWFSRARRFPVCNSDGNYVSLELGYVDATGTLPKALGMLSNSLERIDIQGGPRSFLTGTLPSELELLTLMREFRVSNNDFQGRVDLGRWNFLETLDLSGNRFTGSLPFVRGEWPHATEISLEENYFQGTLPTEIGLCGQLTELKIGDNLVLGPLPTEIGKLTNLQELTLEQNSFDFLPSEIGQLHKLSSLMLYTNKFADSVPSEIGALTELRSLSLAFNDLSGSIPSEIGMLTAIRERLDLSYNSLTSEIPSEIGNLKRMRHLLLHSNKLTGSVPPEVAALDRINTFRVDANNLMGGVSSEICEVFNLTLPYFYADCSEIDCPCCLFCCEDGDGCACRYENTVDQYLCY